MQITQNISTKSYREIASHAPTSIFTRVATGLAAFLRRQKNRRKVKATADLSPQLLDDIGLSRADVDAMGL